MRWLDRNGQEVSGYENPTGLFRFLYDCAAGRVLLRGLIRPGVSRLAGRFLDSGASRVLIAPFIRRSGIDMSAYVPGPFRSFNEFFRRELLPGQRPNSPEGDALRSPCDGKVQVFPIGADSVFEIKGISYTAAQLLQDTALAERFCGGTLLLFRLSVDDYHRFAWPADGIAGQCVHLDGVLHTVDPFAAERRPIYRENIREYTLLETERFGAVLMMEVGALMVGRIVNRFSAGRVCCGEEKGYFEFGASSVILCLEKGAARIDADLWKNTAAGAETVVKLGEHIGCAAEKHN